VSPPEKPCRRCGNPKELGRGSGYCTDCRQIVAERYAPKACIKCGGPKPEGRGRRLCDECRELGRWAARTRHRATKRKACTRCGGPKGPGRYRHLCDRCRYEDEHRVRVCERCQTRPPRAPLTRLCHECKAAAHERDLIRNRKRNREYRRVHGRTPHAVNPRKAENARMRARLQAEREGRPLPALTPEEYRARFGTGFGGAERLPAEPLVPLVQRALESETETGLARRARVADKRVREILSGKSNISLVTADRLCVALGSTLALVYDEAA
jgi:hypothetical protein